MITLRDAIRIESAPEDIFDWFRNLERNYRSWHRDHVKWVFEGGLSEGSVCYCEEFIHGKLHRLRGRITSLRENRLIEFKFFLPSSLVCPRGSFTIKADGGGSIFTATLSFRSGWLFSKLAPQRVNAMRDHMMEEGKNLKRILESGKENQRLGDSALTSEKRPW